MVNLTLTIEEGLLRRARIRALERGTSVNAVVREFLEGYAGTDREREALRSFGKLADRAHASSGPSGRTWSRNDLYE